MVGVSRRAVVSLILAVVLAWSTSSAAAHTEVQRASPGPGDSVTGAVDEIVLVFLDEIRPGITVAVSGPGGTVGAAAPEHDARTVRVSTETMREPGDYVVRYAFTAMDGDHQNEAYRFRIVAADSEPIPVGAVVAGVGAAVGLAAAVVRRRSSPETSSA